MKIIVGLGNPGLRYRSTRHNAGFLALKVASKKHNIPIKKKGFGGTYGIGRINQQEVMLFEPMTFMNLSGEAVKSICKNHLEDDSDLLVVSDDFNLPLGSIRLREKGSAGGHNGLKSIITHIGPEFNRLRIGVASGNFMDLTEEGRDQDVSKYVLSSFPRKERLILDKTLVDVVECMEIWLKEGTIRAMNVYNK